MITFRPHAREDLPLRIKWLNNQSAMKYASDSTEDTDAQKENNWFDDYENNPAKKFFTICADDLPIGFMGVRKIDEKEKIGNVFILIGEDDYRGKGIGLISMNWLIDYAFNVLHLEKLDLEVDKRNLHAIELYKTLNFQTVGEVGDEWEMLLLKKDFIS